MEEKIRTYCLQRGLLQQGDRVLLGFSGGADSVCLLLMLLSMQKELSLTIVPVHVHHNLRAAEADADQHFCEELCKQYDLKLVVCSIAVRQLAQENNWTLEEAGRNARYDAFEKLAAEHHCTKIAVAHHKNDQAETVLFQLLRGSRLRGLSGMEPKNGCLIRPLLAITRTEIDAYLESRHQNYCVDSTNGSVEYTRNRIRHHLIPEAAAIQPKAVEHIAETAEYLQRVERYLEREANQLYALAVEPHTDKRSRSLSIPVLQEAEPLLAEQVIYRTLCEVSGQKKDISAAYVTKCRELFDRQTGRQINLRNGVTARRSYDRLIIERNNENPDRRQSASACEVVSFPTVVTWGEEGRIELSLLENREEIQKKIEKYGGIPKSTYTKWFDYDKIKNGIFVRNPEPDDYLALYEDGRGKSLQSILTDYKVPKEERARTPVLAEGNQILWLLGIRSSEAYRITDMTKRILTVTIHGGREEWKTKSV